MTKPIEGVGTSVAAFVGLPPAPPQPVRTRSSFELAQTFEPRTELGAAVRRFFACGGCEAWVAGDLDGLDAVEDLALLCLPGESDAGVLRAALAYADRRRAFLIVDPPGVDADRAGALARELAETGSANAALYFPPLEIDVDGARRVVAPSGAIAGVYARIDAAYGVWKSPAGDDAILPGVAGLAVELDRDETEELAAAGVNAIRSFPTQGIRVWGARTIAAGSSEWKYVSVRRTALFLERSIDRGLEWAVFEPNDEPLWAQVRADVGAFLHRLFRAGAFAGARVDEAYFVKCGRDTMTQNDIDAGYVHVTIGIAPVRPAEFVTLSIAKQLAPGDPDERPNA